MQWCAPLIAVSILLQVFIALTCVVQALLVYSVVARPSVWLSLQVLFETFNVPALYISMQAVLSL